MTGTRLWLDGVKLVYARVNQRFVGASASERAWRLADKVLPEVVTDGALRRRAAAAVLIAVALTVTWPIGLVACWLFYPDNLVMVAASPLVYGVAMWLLRRAAVEAGTWLVAGLLTAIVVEQVVLGRGLGDPLLVCWAALPMVWAMLVDIRVAALAWCAMVAAAMWLGGDPAVLADPRMVGWCVLLAVTSTTGLNLVWFSQNVAITTDLNREAKALQEANAALSSARVRANAATQAKDDVLGSMSHELRTPLRGVLGVADLLARSEMTDDQRMMVTTMRRSGASLLSVLDDLADVVALSGSRVVVRRRVTEIGAIASAIDARFRHLAEAKGLEFSATVRGQHTNVHIDGNLVEKIGAKLVDNAIKFTRQGRVVLGLTTRVAADGGATLTLSVADTGIGVPQDKLDILFGRFTQLQQSTTREFGGMGVGLSIVDSLTKLLGGEVRVTSLRGQGSTFRVVLPVRLAQMETPYPAHAVAGQASQADARALVLMPRGAPRAVATDVFRRRGLHVEAVALDELEQQHLEQAGLHAVVFYMEHADDVHLEALVGLRASMPEVPMVVACPAAELATVRGAAGTLLYTAVLSEPWSAGELEGALASLGPAVLA